MRTSDGARRDLVVMLLLLAVPLLAAVLFGERILIAHGLGPDGVHFARSAFDPWRALFVEGVDRYYVQRVLPGAIVHLGLVLTGTPAEREQVIGGFAVLDLALLLLSVCLWIGIAKELALSAAARWLGFIALFVNYAVLKHALYAPVMTDVPAFALGLAMLYLYLRGWSAALAVVALAGAFAWPVAAASATPLILWPRGSVASPERERSPTGTAAAALLAAGLVGAFCYMFVVRGIRVVGAGPIVPIVVWAAPLAVALYGAHVFFGVRGVVGGADVPYVRRALAALTAPRVLLALAPLVIAQVLTRLLARPGFENQNLRGFLRFVIFLPNTRPYLFMVAHAAWFGPVVLLLLFFWRDVCRAAWRFGPGLPLLLAFSLLIALTPESRQSTFAWPIFGAMVAVVANERGWSARANWAMAAVALVLSKVWFTLNTPEAIAYGGDSSNLTKELSVRLYYRYLVSHGPLMPNDAYLPQAVVFVALLVAFHVLLRRQAPQLGRATVGERSAPARSQSLGAPVVGYDADAG